MIPKKGLEGRKGEEKGRKEEEKRRKEEGRKDCKRERMRLGEEKSFVKQRQLSTIEQNILNKL
jgi:hypothetical protein